MGKYRIDPVTIDQIMDDFGVSCGDYAMEKEAFERFKTVAEKENIHLSVNEEDCDVPLMLFTVKGVRIPDD